MSLRARGRNRGRAGLTPWVGLQILALPVPEHSPSCAHSRLSSRDQGKTVSHGSFPELSPAGALFTQLGSYVPLWSSDVPAACHTTCTCKSAHLELLFSDVRATSA